MSDGKDLRTGHMTPDEFRKVGKEMVDWIADYMENVGDYPVLSKAEPGDIRSLLPDSPPVKGCGFDEIFPDIEKIIMPGITHWQSPNFYAYFPANSSGPGIIGDLLASGLGVQGMLWSTSPACTELETHVLDWLVDMLELPKCFKSTGRGGGVIQDTASSATLCALLAARERKTKLSSNTKGNPGDLVAYTSVHAHSSLEKAMKIAGLGTVSLRLVDSDENFAMRPDKLEEAIRLDVDAKLRPFFVMGTVGTTSSTAIDPIRRIGELAHSHDMWFHVDAALAGSAGLCPEFRFMFDGLEYAHSYCFNPHKWLLTNFDCSVFYVKNRKDLIDSLSILPEYLRNEASEAGKVIDYRDWHIPLGRRFRSLKLWFVIRYYGIEGLQSYIKEHIKMTQDLASWIIASDQFDLLAPVPLNLVCFAHKSGNRKTRKIMDQLNESGKAFLTHTKLGDRLALRLCIGQTNTKIEDVQSTWEEIKKLS